MTTNPTQKPASVAAFENAQPADHWAIPLDGIIPLSPVVPYADPPRLADPAPESDVLSLDWSFQSIPSEGFHPQLFRRRKAA